MNKIAENALNRVFEPEEKPVRQGWREAFENCNNDDECDELEDEDGHSQEYFNGYSDSVEARERECDCNDCDYCRGYDDAEEEYDDFNNEDHRKCDCGECDYCKRCEKAN